MEIFAFFGTVAWSKPFSNDWKISTLHKSLPYLCVNGVGPCLINSHCFLVSVSNSLSLSSSMINSALSLSESHLQLRGRRTSLALHSTHIPLQPSIMGGMAQDFCPYLANSNTKYSGIGMCMTSSDSALHLTQPLS